MADRYTVTGQGQLKKPTVTGDGKAFSRRHQGQGGYSARSTQLMGIMALVVSSGILLILTGITITTTFLSLIFLVPIIIITSPIWVPTGILLFFFIAGVLSLCGLGVAAAVVVACTSKFL